MKLYVYDINIKYNESLRNFITMSISERNELFKKYKQSEKEVEVELFASGSTCLCYKVVGNDKSKAIYKQFCPLSFEEKGYIVRRDNAVYIHDEVEIDFVKEQYDNFLRQTFNNVVGIGESYNINEINMFIRPEIVLTNLGYLYCAEITGETLEESYNDLLSALGENKDGKAFLMESLYKTFRTLQTVKVAHENDTLILDLKSENLLNVTGDDKKEELFVRLIDFGSCVNLETMESIIEQEGVENFLDQYVYSNRKYYSQEDVKNVVENIAIDKDRFKECAKSLDITAVKKIFCDILLCATNGFKTLDENEEEIQTDSLEEILRDFFLKFSDSISDNLFESFNIYCLLKEFLNANNIYECLQTLVNILSVLKKQVFWGFDIQFGDGLAVVKGQKKSILYNNTIKENYKNPFIKGLNFSELINICIKSNLNSSIDVYEYFSTQGKGIDKNRLGNIDINDDLIKYNYKENKSQLWELVQNEANFPLLIDGDGGRGKSTALINLIIEGIRSNSKVFHKLDLKFLSSVNPTYPIRSLYQASYGGNLDEAIDENFILILDGLNEAEQYFTLIKKDFVDELLNLIKLGCKVIITMRNRELLDKEICKNFICGKILELSPEQVRKVASGYDNSLAPLLKNNYNINMFETVKTIMDDSFNSDDIELERLYHEYCIKARYIANKTQLPEKDIIQWMRHFEECNEDENSYNWRKYFIKNNIKLDVVHTLKDLNKVYKELALHIFDKNRISINCKKKDIEVDNYYKEIYLGAGLLECVYGQQKDHETKWYFTHDRVRDYFEYLFYKNKIEKITSKNFKRESKIILSDLKQMRKEDAIKSVRILNCFLAKVKLYGSIDDEFSTYLNLVISLLALGRERGSGITLGYIDIFKYIEENGIIDKLKDKSKVLDVVEFLRTYATTIWNVNPLKAETLFKLAISYLNKYEKLDESGSVKSSIYSSLGCVYDRTGKDIKQALKFHKLSIEILEKIIGDNVGDKIGNMSALCKSYNNIAQHYWERQKDLKTAIVFYEKSLFLREEIYKNDSRLEFLQNLLMGYINLACILIWDKEKEDYHDINKGLKYIEDAFNHISKVENEDYVYQLEYHKAKLYRNRGLGYEELQDYETARGYYQKSLEIRTNLYINENSKNISDVARAYHEYYKILKLLSLNSKEVNENRLYYLEKAYEISIQLDFKQIRHRQNMEKLLNDLILEYNEIIKSNQSKITCEKKLKECENFLLKLHDFK